MLLDKLIKGFLTSTNIPNDSNVVYDDPTYLGFKLEFDFQGALGWDQVNDLPSPLLFPANNPFSAISYLNSINEIQRAEALNEMINQLRYLQNDTPWYFQSITGLAEAYKYNRDEPYRGGEDKKLEIECLESVDLKISFLIDLYRKVAFDVSTWCSVLPPNMRYFDLNVYVAEIRRFHTTRELLGQTDNTFRNGQDEDGFRLLNSFNSNISTILFKFKKCEFNVFEEYSIPFIETLTNTGEEQATNKLEIKYKSVTEATSYRLLDYLLMDTSYQSGDNPTETGRAISKRGENNITDYSPLIHPFVTNRSSYKNERNSSINNIISQNVTTKQNREAERTEEDNLRTLRSNSLINSGLNIAENIAENFVNGIVAEAILGDASLRKVNNPSDGSLTPTNANLRAVNNRSDGSI